MPLKPDQFGLYHPASNDDVIALVNFAREHKKSVRTCGAAHSQSWAIYTDAAMLQPNVTNQSPPEVNSNEINIILDQMMQVELINPSLNIVRAQAGVHLGYDPSDITGQSSEQNSLLYQLWHNYKLTVSELGGITHQTLGGFISTGSAGGSLKYSFQDNIVGIHFVDGHGRLQYASRYKNIDLFYAAMVSMGLLGVIVAVDLQCEPAFNICGQEATVSYDECQFDMFGESKDKPSLLDFFNSVDYGRVNWWPQPGVNRLLPWQAQRQQQVVGFSPRPYEEFTSYPEAAEPVISIIYAILGNLDSPIRLYEKVQTGIIALEKVINSITDYSQFGIFAPLFEKIIEALKDVSPLAFVALIEKERGWIKQNLPVILQQVINIFQSLDSNKLGKLKGTPQVFQDHAPLGLPMDNEASDELLDIEFSELWFPVGRTNEVMQVLRDYFDSAANDQEKLTRTGLFTIEVYMAKACQAWMGMGYSDQMDEWKEGAVRFEPLWFVDFDEDPALAFYPQFWQLFKDKGIPYRLHWGKMLPNLGQPGSHEWMDYVRQQYPKLADFLALRAELDPEQIFVSDYWRGHLKVERNGH
ncbi:D-arabinono-1,4-lactone oxidase [Motilimonas sp. E26]|uniref:D-arabinono-1,4-lactone oxidase n=1 Tax=Motilimonas sp. E26 TaxID=2865674 RepID=UPI001E3D23B9|nr:D-arabinono-1,4-lactone oxidase [Motilimonas sp. E26]MCE0558515.1 hypothetical protein [Motilimonas sp. E26]